MFEEHKVKNAFAKDEAISKLMKGTEELKHNKILQMARGLN